MQFLHDFIIIEMDEYTSSTLSISMLDNEIKKLRITEDMKRREHASLQDGLQDTWDKLVNLRSHISLFKSSIEEVRVEEATYMAHAFAESNEGKSSELTSEMATRLGSLHALREKVRLKEALKSKIVMMEEQLDSMRTKLSQNMQELSRSSQSSVINSASAHAVTSPSRSPRQPRRSTSPTPFQVLAKTEEHRVEDAMSVRTTVLETSRQLEILEKNYIQAVSELEFVELEINQVLQWNPEYLESSSDIGNGASSEGDRGTSSAYSLDDSSSTTTQQQHQPSYCPVSLHEILSGQAHIMRINGESPTKYRQRLEKRLAALLVLDEQLQKELNVKNGIVNKVRSVLKDIEIQRLRKEVELNTLQQQFQNSLTNMVVYNQTSQQITSTTTIDNNSGDRDPKPQDIQLASGLLVGDLNSSGASADSGFRPQGESVDDDGTRFPGSMMMPSRSGQEDDLPLRALSGIKAGRQDHNESMMSPSTPFAGTHSNNKTSSSSTSKKRTQTHTVSTHTKTETHTSTATSGGSNSGDTRKPSSYVYKGPRKPLGHINDPEHSQLHSSAPEGDSPTDTPSYSHIGSEPKYPYGNSDGSLNSTKKSTKSQVENMLQRLEALALQMEQKIELTTGHKELVNTVSRQQEDLDSLRITQSNLVKLLNSESALDSEKSKEAIRNLEYNVHDVSARHQELRKLREHLDDPNYIHVGRTGGDLALTRDDESHVRLLSIGSDADADAPCSPASNVGPGTGHGATFTDTGADMHRSSRHVSPEHYHGRSRSNSSSSSAHSDTHSTFGHSHDSVDPGSSHGMEDATDDHHQSLDSKSAMILQYDEHYQGLLKKCNFYREKYNEALHSEFIDGATDTCIDGITRLSTATLDVKVKSARNLPITKRVTNSSDPFIELFLVSTAAVVSADKTVPGDENANPDSINASSFDGQVLKGSSLNAGTAESESSAVNVFNKQSFSTHVVHNDIRPRWEESFKFNELFNQHVDSSVTTPLSHLSQANNNAIDQLSKSLSVFLLLMDHNRTAVADIIGECSISLSDFVDQEKHVIWAPIRPPVMEVVRSRPKLPKDCAVKLEIRLNFNKQRVWKQRFNNANREITKYIEQFRQQQLLNQEREASLRKRKQEEAELSKHNKGGEGDTEGEDKDKNKNKRSAAKTPPRGQGPRPKTSSSGVKFTTKRMMELASRGQLNKPTSPESTTKKPPSPSRAVTTPAAKHTATPPKTAAKANKVTSSGIKLTLQYRIGGNNNRNSIQTPFGARAVREDATTLNLSVSELQSEGETVPPATGSPTKAAYVCLPITAATRQELGLSNNVATPFAKPLSPKARSQSAGKLKTIAPLNFGVGTGDGDPNNTLDSPSSDLYSPTQFVRSPNLRTVKHSVDSHHRSTSPMEFHSPKKKAYDKKAFLASLISSRNGKKQLTPREDLSSYEPAQTPHEHNPSITYTDNSSSASSDGEIAYDDEMY